MDIEGYAKKALINNESKQQIEEKLTSRIMEIKDVSFEYANSLAKAAIIEADATLNVSGILLTPTISGITMGQAGVGSRGIGDFYVHEKIGEIIGKTDAIIDSSHLDDSGVVEIQENGKYLVVTIDGIHSRLSDFPFLAGFHVARAALRDIYVMGSKPIALLSDIHIADDGDVAKIFDHIAGITTVAELVGVPLITGSTLRIGGDMVIGNRMTGGVGAVGVTSDLTSRGQAKCGDVILMTEGAGGGTISTTALYYGMHDIVDETINVTFLNAAEALIDSGLVKYIHAMTDVTNGGIRGDAMEISKTAKIKLVFDEEKIRPLVNTKVLNMLESLNIDYLGVSLDALLIIAPKEYSEEIIRTVRDKKISIDIIGFIEEGKGAEIIIDGVRKEFVPRFRESAYTPIKKIIGDNTPNNFEEIKNAIDNAAIESIHKKKQVIKIVERKSVVKD